MPTVTLTGPFGGKIEAVRNALAASADFQTWTGSANSAEALTRVCRTVQDYDELTRPFAVVMLGEGTRLTANAMGTGRDFPPTAAGEVMVMLEAAEEAAYSEDVELSVARFMERVLGVMDDLVAIAGTDGYADIRELAPLEAVPEELGEEYGLDGRVWNWVWGVMT